MRGTAVPDAIIPPCASDVASLVHMTINIQSSDVSLHKGSRFTEPAPANKREMLIFYAFVCKLSSTFVASRHLGCDHIIYFLVSPLCVNKARGTRPVCLQYKRQRIRTLKPFRNCYFPSIHKISILAT